MHSSFALRIALAGLLYGGMLLPLQTEAQRPRTPDRGYSESRSPTSAHPHRPPRSTDAPTSLPDWAQPQRPSHSRGEDPAPGQTARPKLSPPEEPRRNVPIGGGLEYLALAGLVYAAHRLRER